MRKWEPTPEILQQVEDWIAEGMTQQSICMKLGMTPTTFTTKKRDYPELQEAVLRGKGRDEDVCMNLLRQRAMDDKYKGSLTALIFYGKINFGWNDGSFTKNQPKPNKIKFKSID